jgi:hypothetical protein
LQIQGLHGALSRERESLPRLAFMQREAAE